jgi:hypothetical protein
LEHCALEEVRLLTCARPNTRAPFSLLLVGDDSLLPRLQLGINRALISRLGLVDQWPDDSFAPTSLFPLGLWNVALGTKIFHLNLRPN